MLRTWNYAWWKPIVGILMVVLAAGHRAAAADLPGAAHRGALRARRHDATATASSRPLTLDEVTPSGLLYLNLALGAMILWVGLRHARAAPPAAALARPRWCPGCGGASWPAVLGLAVVALIAQVVVGTLVPQSANPDVGRSGQRRHRHDHRAGGRRDPAHHALQAAGEEYAFRGYLLQAIGPLARHPRGSAIVAHGAALRVRPPGSSNRPLFFDRFMFGLIAAWLVIRTGGLEAGIALHMLNNCLAFGFAIAFTDLDSALDRRRGQLVEHPRDAHPVARVRWCWCCWWPAVQGAADDPATGPGRACRGTRGGGLRRRGVRHLSPGPRSWSRPGRTCILNRASQEADGPRKGPASHGVWGNWQPDWFWSS